MVATRSTAPGVRARNLARNRAEVSEVALRLFAARGVDAVTVEDIAEAAGISRRTFFRWFESKEEAVLPYEAERLELLRTALAARAADQPVLHAIRGATRALATGPGAIERDETLRRLRIVRDNPSVHAHSLEIQSRWEVAIADVIAEHLGVDPATSVAARVIAGATVATVRAAAEVWLATDGEADLPALLGEAYDLLVDGLSVPT